LIKVLLKKMMFKRMNVLIKSKVLKLEKKRVRRFKTNKKMIMKINQLRFKKNKSKQKLSKKLLKLKKNKKLNKLRPKKKVMMQLMIGKQLMLMK